MIRITLLLVCATFAGCASLSDSRTPEQITAMAKDKSVTAECTKLNTPWGPQVRVALSVDQRALEQGVMGVDEQCKIQYQSERAVRAARAASAP